MGAVARISPSKIINVIFFLKEKLISLLVFLVWLNGKQNHETAGRHKPATHAIPEGPLVGEVVTSSVSCDASF